MKFRVDTKVASGHSAGLSQRPILVALFILTWGFAAVGSEAGALQNSTAARSENGRSRPILLAQALRDARPTFSVKGFVVDEVTREPVPQFEATVGEIRGDQSPNFRSTPKATGTKGKFHLRVPYPRFFHQYVIKIEAEGYLPIVSTNLFTELGDQQLEFALKPGNGIGGVVRLPDGKPAPATTVYLEGRDENVHMDKPATVMQRVSSALSTVTDIKRHFQFPPTLDAHTIIAVHDAGYAELPAMEVQRTGVVDLKSYGRVEGTLLVRGKPAANETVAVTTMHYKYGDGIRNFAPLSLWLSTTTDAEGGFVLDRVPPGERHVAHRLSFRDGRLGVIPVAHSRALRVKAGQTVQVQLGGTGRTIIGRLAAPDGAPAVDWQRDVQKLRTKEQTAPLPRREDFPTSQEFSNAMRQYSRGIKAFWLSEAGRALQWNLSEHAADMAKDGSFFISDVPPGDYEFKIMVTGPHDRDAAGNNLDGRPLYSLTLDVTVPKTPGGYSDVPIDLGTLVLKPVER